MRISLIAAFSINHVIGMQNSLPWRLPADLAWFRRHTVNKPVIMGRKTFASIGQPLHERTNIVLSRQPPPASNAKELLWASSIAEALALAAGSVEVMIAGGGGIYAQFLPYADRMYLTHVATEVVGDTYFPAYSPDEWESSFNEFHPADQKNAYNYFFEILERR